VNDRVARYFLLAFRGVRCRFGAGSGRLITSKSSLSSCERHSDALRALREMPVCHRRPEVELSR
jgi:hypothetical protein